MVISMSMFNGSPVRTTSIGFQHLHSPSKTCQHLQLLQHPSHGKQPVPKHPHHAPGDLLPDPAPASTSRNAQTQAARLLPLPSSTASLSSSNKVSRHTRPAVTSPWRWEGRNKGVKGGQLIPQTPPGWDAHGLGESSF